MAGDPNQFYVTLFSTASQELFPDNTFNAFTIQLAQTIDLGPNDRWEVGLCEFSNPTQNKRMIKPVLNVGETNALIYFNLIQPQFVENELIRSLRFIFTPSLNCEHYFDHIYYLPVEKRHIRHITIEIKDLTGKPLKIVQCLQNCATFPAYPDMVIPIKTRHHDVISAFYDYGSSCNVLCTCWWWWGEEVIIGLVPSIFPSFRATRAWHR